MAIQTKAQLKAFIDANIDTNGTNSITGAQLNSILSDLVDSLKIDTDLNEVDNTSDADKPISTAQATEFANKKNLSDEETELDFAATTAWDFDNKQSAIFKIALTADLTPVFSNDTNLRTAVGEFDITNEVDITFNSSWVAVTLPSSATFASNVLTLNPPNANTIYNFFAWKINGKWKFNLSEEAQ